VTAPTDNPSVITKKIHNLKKIKMERENAYVVCGVSMEVDQNPSKQQRNKENLNSKEDSGANQNSQAETVNRKEQDPEEADESFESDEDSAEAQLKLMIVHDIFEAKKVALEVIQVEGKKKVKFSKAFNSKNSVFF
jgi:hypothetical protein